ncbi:hypothetical protein [Endozoicomonas sp. 4G]|uniref:hypothetical protein n=1 Tax=Endozoicomonas sp. 4G TaxID=2872754 RepID=UPI00207895C9|nr:hypothetical protein [Endozoicomonas sp. 4G]
MFVNAQQQAIDHPETFKAPTPGELAQVRKGSFVKVCAEPERFWVLVEHVIDGMVQGVIDNDLIFTERHGLVCDQRISFELDKIYQIHSEID